MATACKNHCFTIYVGEVCVHLVPSDISIEQEHSFFLCGVTSWVREKKWKEQSESDNYKSLEFNVKKKTKNRKNGYWEGYNKDI